MNEDLSNLFDKFNINKDSISPEMINNLMTMLNNSSGSADSSDTNNNFQNENFARRLCPEMLILLILRLF